MEISMQKRTEDTALVQFYIPRPLAEDMKRSAKAELISAAAFMRRAVARAVAESAPIRAA
jgi:hypothetical protein